VAANSSKYGPILIALGGNAISVEGEEGNIHQQFQHAAETMNEVVEAVRIGYEQIVLVHGNGPQIGNILMRSEMASPQVYPLPLDTCVSDSAGGMGYMLQQVLHNTLCDHQMEKCVVTLVTQTLVDSDDPNWKNPTKFIGPFYAQSDAQRMMAQQGWRMRQDSTRGWRRVVPSPAPLAVIELEAIRCLLTSGVIVIAGGGGGIPVTRDSDGRLHGAEAVVDKDLVSALLAVTLGIPAFAILTAVEQVMLDFGKPSQRPIANMTLAEARKHMADGQFPPGSMGPKIAAAMYFLEKGGSEVIITRPTLLSSALRGETGTRIRKD
jgi:carbamate kinase